MGCFTLLDVTLRNKQLPNAPEVQTQGEFINTESHEAIQILSQVVTSQVGQQSGNQQEVPYTLRIREFFRMNLQVSRIQALQKIWIILLRN